MKKVILILIAAMALSVASPLAPTVEASGAKRYVYTHKDGWPKWIGRINLYETYKQKPEMSSKYLPLALIKTGRFQEIVDEVRETPNVDISEWPDWIGEITR